MGAPVGDASSSTASTSYASNPSSSSSFFNYNSLKGHLKKYGRTGIVVYLGISGCVTAGFYIAIERHFDAKKWLGIKEGEREPTLFEKMVTGKGSSIALAILCSKAMVPIKLPVAVAVTPYVHRAPDPWDLPKQPVKLSCGYSDGLTTKYKNTGQTLGKGGFGIVTVVVSLSSGQEYACKSIQKLLDVPNVAPIKQQQHLTNIKQEVTVLRKLRGTLNVVHLDDVFEDDTHVHVVMELCRGGELLQNVSSRHYSERTVASYMRAVLRTLAQCHHHRILHRDIKPGNFMLLTTAESSPIKAIDFGLAVFYDPKALPMRNLGLEGTPHYMAPEVLSSEVYPASDVWAAGVMAYHLMSGRFPFDDWKNLRNPALSQLWKSILTDEPKFTGAAWQDVSQGAKDFICSLLTKDVKSRPSAQEALSHPWIQGKSKQRSEGKPLAATIVQRLQRFSTANAFKRTVLDMIANELLMQHMQQQMAAKARQTMQAAKTGSQAAQQQPAGLLEAGTGQQAAESAQADVSTTAIPGLEAQHVVHVPPPPQLQGVITGDPINPQIRSQAAVSLLQALHNKSATVHAGSALGYLLRGTLAGSGQDGKPGVPTRGASLDATPSQAAYTKDRSGSPVAAQARAGGTHMIRSHSTVSDSGVVAQGVMAAPTQQPPQQQSHLAQQQQQQQEARQRDTAEQQGATVTELEMDIVQSPASPDQPDHSNSDVSLIANTPEPLPGGQSPPFVRDITKQPSKLGEPMRASVPPSLPPHIAVNQHYAAIQQSFAATSTAATSGVSFGHSGRKQLSDGSGHALQHYAFLLAAGERSLHGISQRHTMARSLSHASLASGQSADHNITSTPPQEPTTPTVPTGTQTHAVVRQRSSLQTHRPPMPYVAGSHGALSSLATISAEHGALAGIKRGVERSSSSWNAMPGQEHEHSLQTYSVSPQQLGNVQRLLGTVSRQRQEHRKLQRLMLDTSGHAQNLYNASQLGQAAQGATAGVADDTDMDMGVVDLEAVEDVPKKKSLLQKVGRALLKPVKELLGGGGGSSSTTPAAQAASTTSTRSQPSQAGGFGSYLPSADVSQHRPDASPKSSFSESTNMSTEDSSALSGPIDSQLKQAKSKPVSALTEAIAAAEAGEKRKEDSVTGLPGRLSGSVPSASTAPSFSLVDVIASDKMITGGETPETAKKPAENLEAGGRGKGAYAALLGGKLSPTDQPESAVAQDAATVPVSETQEAEGVIAPALSSAMPSIRTVKAHKSVTAPTNGQTVVPPDQSSPAPQQEDHTIAAQLARLAERTHASADEDDMDDDSHAEGHAEGTVSKGTVYDVLGNLLGGPAQLAEFQAVLQKLKYDSRNELSFEEISEGLKCLGYRLEPSEVETLLSEVALGGQHISQAQFLASQVDWRQFQANHRDEWLALLRKTFDGLARETDGRIGEDQIVALLQNKLPAEQVNLAVQETLLDAAVLGAEGLDFDDFARLLQADSETDALSVGSYGGQSSLLATSLGGGGGLVQGSSGSGTIKRSPSIDLYDARMDTSLHGQRMSAAGPLPPAAVTSTSVGVGKLPGLTATVANSPFFVPGPGLNALPSSWLAGQLDHGSVHGTIHGHGYQPGLETVPDQDDE